MSGVIYKITVGNEVYVGSTISFNQRRWRHKHNIYDENGSTYNCKLYKTIRENNGEYEFTIYEDNLSMTKDELCIREEEVRLLLGATLNCRRAYRTQEYEKIRYNNNKEQILKNVKIYRDENKEKIKEREKQKIKCECGSIVRRYEISRHRKTNKHITLMTLQA